MWEEWEEELIGEDPGSGVGGGGGGGLCLGVYV